jgi:hypothetical protein
MIPALDFSSLKSAQWWQFAVRFFLGGAITLCTGLISRHFGPVVGGLFLSFPAIFPATATLIARQETLKKRKAGITDRTRGRKAAALDAAGAVFGGWGMVVFGCASWLTLDSYPMALGLALAAVLWLIVSASLWWGHRHRGR